MKTQKRFTARFPPKNHDSITFSKKASDSLIFKSPKVTALTNIVRKNCLCWILTQPSISRGLCD